MRRLYLRLYFAVLLSLVVFALIAGLVFRLGEDVYGPRHMAPDLAGNLIADLLPQGGAGGANPQAAQAIEQTLQRWHHRARVDITLYDERGAVVASVGPLLALPESGRSGWTSAGRGPPAFVADLPDGKRMVLKRMRPPGAPPTRWPGFFVMLVLIALGVGVGAYPVVRKLTGRIERLQNSVVALGAGDLSSRVKVEGRDEVASLATSFNHSAGRIEALVQAQKDLLANASHELRSPLARIRMAIELLSPQASEQVRQELNRDITELDQLIDEILLASRLDAGVISGGPSGAGVGVGGGAVTGADGVVIDPAWEEVDLMALCAEECARVGLDLSLRHPGDDQSGVDLSGALIQGDARLLRRMVRNLIENALRYGQGKPVQVWLDLAPPQPRPMRGVAIEVEDQGPGVPEAERERIFEPFYRARGASEHQGGVGLGLSLARRIAARHGASISCQPRDGGGSRFVVQFAA